MTVLKMFCLSLSRSYSEMWHAVFSCVWFVPCLSSRADWALWPVCNLQWSTLRFKTTSWSSEGTFTESNSTRIPSWDKTLTKSRPVPLPQRHALQRRLQPPSGEPQVHWPPGKVWWQLSGALIPVQRRRWGDQKSHWGDFELNLSGSVSKNVNISQ